jgi:hypothetical protein
MRILFEHSALNHVIFVCDEDSVWALGAESRYFCLWWGFCLSTRRWITLFLFVMRILFEHSTLNHVIFVCNEDSVWALDAESLYFFLCVIFRAFTFIIAIIFQHMHNFSPLYCLYLPTCFGPSGPSSGRYKLPKVID